MRRNEVALTSFRRHVPTRFLINQCQIITFIILKSDIIENSRIELRGIVLPAPSSQIKVTFIILLFNLVHLWFFPVSHRNWRKRWVDYWGGGGGRGGQRLCWPPPHPLKLLGGGGWPPLAPPLPRSMLGTVLSNKKDFHVTPPALVTLTCFSTIFYTNRKEQKK